MHPIRQKLLSNPSLLPYKCFLDDPRVGEIDQIISKLNMIEDKFFYKGKDDIRKNWWDFVRHSVIKSLCVEKSIYPSTN